MPPEGGFPPHFGIKHHDWYICGKDNSKLCRYVIKVGAKVAMSCKGATLSAADAAKLETDVTQFWTDVVRPITNIAQMSLRLVQTPKRLIQLSWSPMMRGHLQMSHNLLQGPTSLVRMSHNRLQAGKDVTEHGKHAFNLASDKIRLIID